MRGVVISNDRHKQTPVISEHQSLNNFWGFLDFEFNQKN